MTIEQRMVNTLLCYIHVHGIGEVTYWSLVKENSNFYLPPSLSLLSPSVTPLPFLFVVWSKNIFFISQNKGMCMYILNWA